MSTLPNVRVTAPITTSETSILLYCREVELWVHKLKGIPFETAIIGRYHRREKSISRLNVFV